MTDRIEINPPDAEAEVRALCAGYEQALMANDLPALKAYFWDSAHALRFGAGEELYGAAAIDAFRAARPMNFTDRQVLRETVLALGPDFAVSALEFFVTAAGTPRHGRQTQVWVRFPDQGWRIVSAHVSHRAAPASGAAAYAAAAAAFLPLPIDPAFQAGVAANIAIMAQIAQPLLDAEFPETEPAPRFTP